MSAIVDHRIPPRPIGVSMRMTAAVFLPLFAATEALTRWAHRTFAEPDEVLPAERPLFAVAREHAAIAASYAFMARSMLKESGRRPRPVRPS
jgi:hypothetical protein